MSRLDRHVAVVRNKLALEQFCQGLAWSLIVFLSLVWVLVLVDRLVQVRLPHQGIWFWSGLGSAVLFAIGYALLRMPSEQAAAVAIDTKLGLKEKFSTALYIRSSKDSFARAAVGDAERTADNVSLHKRFTVRFPAVGMWVPVLAVGAFLSAQFIPALDLFGHEAKRKQVAWEQQKKEEARETVKKAIALVESNPQVTANDEALKQAQQELAELLKGPIRDPEKANRSAIKALQELHKAQKEEVNKSQVFANAQNQSKAFKNVAPGESDKGPVADAQRAIAKGDFMGAAEELQTLAKKFETMDKPEQEKAMQQMQKMAQQLQQMAADPQNQQQMQQKLQQMGANPQQAQQLAQAMQQAAAGNPQAQQQLQQMAQKMAQQMNNGQGATQQQQNQLNQMMQQMQAQAAAQQQAGQMGQACQAMAQAMQQCQQGNQQPGQQGQQQMQQAAGAMQAQLQQLDAVAKDAQQQAAQQQAVQQAMQQMANGMNGQGQNGQDGQNQGQGQWKAGNPDQRGGQGGQGGPAVAAGGARPPGEEAPFGIKPEMSPSQINENGKVLAATLVKADSLKGESKATVKEVAVSESNQAPDEVDQERVARPAQQSVKKYFKSMEEDAK